MISVIAGLVVAGAGMSGIWYSKPQAGEMRWFVAAPVLEWLLPVGLVAALALGIGLIVSGVVSG